MTLQTAKNYATKSEATFAVKVSLVFILEYTFCYHTHTKKWKKVCRHRSLCRRPAAAIQKTSDFLSEEYSPPPFFFLLLRSQCNKIMQMIIYGTDKKIFFHTFSNIYLVGDMGGPFASLISICRLNERPFFNKFHF